MRTEEGGAGGQLSGQWLDGANSGASPPPPSHSFCPALTSRGKEREVIDFRWRKKTHTHTHTKFDFFFSFFSSFFLLFSSFLLSFF